MGASDADTAVIFEKLSNIERGIEEIKETCRGRDRECDSKFCDVYNRIHKVDLKVTNNQGETRTNRAISKDRVTTLGLVITCFISLCVAIVSWFRGG